MYKITADLLGELFDLAGILLPSREDLVEVEVTSRLTRVCHISMNTQTLLHMRLQCVTHHSITAVHRDWARTVQLQ